MADVEVNGDAKSAGVVPMASVARSPLPEMLMSPSTFFSLGMSSTESAPLLVTSTTVDCAEPTRPASSGREKDVSADVDVISTYPAVVSAGREKVARLVAPEVMMTAVTRAKLGKMEATSVTPPPEMVNVPAIVVVSGSAVAVPSAVKSITRLSMIVLHPWPWYAVLKSAAVVYVAVSPTSSHASTSGACSSSAATRTVVMRRRRERCDMPDCWWQRAAGRKKVSEA